MRSLNVTHINDTKENTRVELDDLYNIKYHNVFVQSDGEDGLLLAYHQRICLTLCLPYLIYGPWNIRAAL